MSEAREIQEQYTALLQVGYGLQTSVDSIDKRTEAALGDIPEWVNEPGYRHHAERGFEGALDQIRKEKHAPSEADPLQQIISGASAAGEELSTGSTYPPPERGSHAAATGYVVIGTVVGTLGGFLMLLWMIGS
jgi:hypothetical protein